MKIQHTVLHNRDHDPLKRGSRVSSQALTGSLTRAIHFLETCVRDTVPLLRESTASSFGRALKGAERWAERDCNWL